MRFRVTLEGVEPAVWRVVDVPADAYLPLLSRVILAAMGWTDVHLHQFRAGRIRFSIPGDECDPYRFVQEQTTPVAALFGSPGDACEYVYDFGDHWQHTVELSDFFEREPGVKLPRLVDGAMACPPEDSGGPMFYVPAAFDIERAMKRVARISTRTLRRR